MQSHVGFWGRQLGLVTVITTLAGTLYATPQPRPRIWLDDTTMARLQAARTANTPEYQTLKNWCDARLGQNLNEGYQWLDWYTYLHNYALLYRITGDARYGNKGVVYLKALLRDRYTHGDGLGGPNAIQVDSGYVSRSMGVGVCIGRDWLYDAPDMTPALVQECTARMNDWYPWIHRPQTYGINEPWVNYWAGHFGMTWGAYIAFEGDPGYNPAWETKAEEMWADAVETFNGPHAGGDYSEGWNYGPRALRHTLGYPWAVETGTDRPDNHWDEITACDELVYGQLHWLHPSRELLSDDGRWTGDLKGDPRPATAAFLSVLTDTSPQAKGLARWYATNLNAGASSIDPWEAVLFTDRSITPIAPTAANAGGLTWQSYGNAATRSHEWSNLDATWVAVHAWTDFGISLSYGDVKIASRRKPLLVDGNMWQLEGSYANMPAITGSHTYAPYQEYWHEDTSMKVDARDGVYTYFKLDNLRALYDGNHNNNPSAQFFQRDVVFVAPDHVIVFDNIRVTALPTNTVREQWFTMGNPTLAGDTATLTNGTARLFLRTITPPVTLAKASNSARAGTWRVDATPVTAAVTNHILTAFETAGSTQAAMTPIAEQAGFGMKGVHIQDPAGPAIVLCSIGEASPQTSATFTFQPVATTTRVVLTGMTPGGYGLNVTPATGGGVQVNAFANAGGPHMATANGSLTFEVTATLPPPASSHMKVY